MSDARPPHRLDLPLGFDADPVARRIGLVVLATDHTTEPDFARMVAGPRLGVYVARIAYANPTTPENLAAMQPDLARGAALLLPDERLDAICYSCTSASVVIGDDERAQVASLNEVGHFDAMRDRVTGPDGEGFEDPSPTPSGSQDEP